MLWLPCEDKKFEDTFIRFDMIRECDRHTDRQAPHDGMAALMHSIARQKGLKLRLSTNILLYLGNDTR